MPTVRAAPGTYRPSDHWAAVHSPSVGEIEPSTPPTELRCEIARNGTVACVRPFGELDLDSVHRVEAALDGLHAEGCANIVLDLRGLTFMDSTGLRLVIRWDTAAREATSGSRSCPATRSSTACSI